ncbi:MAG: glycoside hydrolase family 78 protein [Bacteroidales bacterium]|jgi:alpha-L-rhamnosidase|nr:glycoside hydrolase family 78 protein [Bacteroidales bacterium]
MKNTYCTILLFCSFCLLTACSEDADIDVARLRCEYLVNPRGIDYLSPRLSWEVQSNERAVRQKDYHILVASSMEKLNAGEGDLWDSRKVKSGSTLGITYGGKELESGMTCYWKVKVSTNKGMSEWSEPASWTMGLLHQTDWKAQWIGLDKAFPGDRTEGNTRLSARYFRKEFPVNKKIREATLYISGLGLYEAYMNGHRIGDQVLSPTPTDYTKSVKYNVFDVTQLLNNGENAVGVILGNGRYFAMRQHGMRHFGFPKMLFQLEITYEDGDKQMIVSNDNWKVTVNGPIRSNNEFDGEEYDARMEMSGWNTPGFDDGQWLKPELVVAPGGKIEAQLNKNIRVMETIRPVGITEVKPGLFIMDMGQNMVGWLRMKVKGKKGDQVQLRFAELVKEDGTLYMANLRGALVTDKYILKGDGTEVWEPSFTYHGFRFVEITGFPGKPTINDFEGQVVYDEMELAGHFETSDPTLNQIYKNAYWGIRGNYRGMPTDCPQRDERMGWLGDRAVGSHGESFIFDNNMLYAKWLKDIEECQKEEGSISDVAPNFWSIYSDNMTWPGAYLIIANMLYEQYGNMEPIIKHYASMKKWLDYMRDKYMVDHIMTKDRYGDWCMPPELPELIHSKDPARKTDAAVLGTTFYFRMLYLLERFATLQGKTEDARSFAEQAVVVKNAYNEKFFNNEKAQYSNNTVTANLLSLCYGMVPEGYEDAVFKNIVDKTMGDFNGHVSTGLVGIQWLMRGLSDYGRPDIALKIATNRDYPSWGYMIEKGATTIWELWNGDTADPAMNSANHVMLLGDVIVWFYEYLAGIQNAPSGVGFEKIRMKPYPIAGLNHVSASYHSVRGPIKSAWRKNNDHFEWEITIPGNTSAVVYIPASDKGKVTESGQKASSAKGVKYLKMDGDYAVFEVGSGDYNFKVIQ